MIDMWGEVWLYFAAVVDFVNKLADKDGFVVRPWSIKSSGVLPFFIPWSEIVLGKIATILTAF